METTNIDINGSIAEETMNKWSPVLEGVDDDYQRRVTAQLLENQAKSILSEQRLDEGVAANIGGMNTTGRFGTFAKFAFPLVRRVYPELIANNIVGVQPMQGPVSQIFYLGNTRRNAASNDTELIYSKYNLTYRGLVASAIFSAGNFGTDGDDTNAGNVSDLLGGPQNTTLPNIMSGTPSTTIGGQIANWPPADLANQRPIPGAGPAYLLGFQVSAGERMEGSGIPEMMFNIEQQPVAARTRKMRALWTLEAAQDLRAYHNLDLERELTDLLGKELRLEIDREIIEDLRMMAYGVGKQSANNPGTFWDRQALDQGSNGPNGPNFSFEPDFTTASAFTYDFPNAYQNNENQYENVFVLDFSSSALDFAPQHVGQVYANLLALCQIASTDIYKTTLRGPGNFIVTSPLVGAFLQSAAKLEGGIEKVDGPTNMKGARVEYKGKLAGQWDLYLDPMYPDDEIMIGYKGSNAMDSGYVYAPYIPLQQTPTIVDPETFQPRKGIITRYGKAAISPASRFYRIIRIIGPTANYLFTPFAKIKNNAWA